jgi:hypothetical protein
MTGLKFQANYYIQESASSVVSLAFPDVMGRFQA